MGELDPQVALIAMGEEGPYYWPLRSTRGGGCLEREG
jgi:hypothetical protein